ncbi:MAG: hypothetical protein OEW42_18770, partial [Acidimicrobiia bacterium]|nr:hypothetical protein [Acidimicrobiia bacterium]
VEPRLGIDDLKGLPSYELVVHSEATGYQLTVTGRTEALGPSLGTGERLRQLSRQRWGTPIEDIDTGMAHRQELDGHTERPPRLGPRPRSDDGSDGSGEAA